MLAKVCPPCKNMQQRALLCHKTLTFFAYPAAIEVERHNPGSCLTGFTNKFGLSHFSLAGQMCLKPRICTDKSATPSCVLFVDSTVQLDDVWALHIIVTLSVLVLCVCEASIDPMSSRTVDSFEGYFASSNLRVTFV
ncbi:hypothetical protein XENORESO_006660 [Xenotaenia resolanae]|uniref:Uncharacterized protein n=1 Tax=Xenotaenia resolanae TaxID=208358 RepID=A0ABV0VVA3_9TELE